MAIKINWQDLQARYINGNSVEKVMLNGGQIRPWTTPPPVPAEEYIEYQYRSFNSFGRQAVLIPCGWYDHNGQITYIHDWYISIDGGEPFRNNSSTWWFARYVDNSGLHTIKITPVVATYWWALAFWWSGVTGSYVNGLERVTYDDSYMWYAVSATDTWDYFRYQQYKGCSSLNRITAETLPNSVTTIWDYFRAQQFMNTRLQYAYFTTAEAMPDSVTSIWTHFREEQYRWSSITWSANEVMSSNITVIPDYFRVRQFAYCGSLQQAGAEALPNGVITIWDEFRAYQYISNGQLRETGVEALPDTLMSMWEYFREYQYAQCSNLQNIRGWKDLNIWWWHYRDDMFYQSNHSKTITVVSDVGFGMYIGDATSVWLWWLDSATEIKVPNAYLSNYQSTGVTPWDYVYPKSKFTWV